MNRLPIANEKLIVRPYGLFEKQWMLLTSGDFQATQFNAMTISWGALGVMWNKPFAQVVVRPVRYTYEFMEKFDSFTICAFPEKYHGVLSMLGTTSGREANKIAASGLTPIAAACIPAPAYQEADLVIECKKMYWQDFDPRHFLRPEIDRNYPEKDYHRIYYGEIVAVQGTEKYAAQ